MIVWLDWPICSKTFSTWNLFNLDVPVVRLALGFRHLIAQHLGYHADVASEEADLVIIRVCDTSRLFVFVVYAKHGMSV